MGRIRIRITGRALIGSALWLLVLPLPWVAAAAASAAVHELGHLIALWAWGVPVFGVELDLGGVVIRTGPMEPREELCCALAGPLAGMLICLFRRWIPGMCLCAVVQTGINLLPFYPLDGGRAVKAVRNICCKERGKGL